MTAQPPLLRDLDRIFGPGERTSEDRTGRDGVRVLEARREQLERQQQVFEEEHQRIVTQLLATSDALMTEQRTALARLDQEVADRTRSWRERAVILEQAQAASEAERLATQQHLLNLAYALDAQIKVVLEAADVVGKGINTEEAREALESIRSSAAAVLHTIDACCGREASVMDGWDIRGTGELDDDTGVPCQVKRSLEDSGAPFDRAVVMACAGTDEALLQELATLFLTEGPKHLLELKAALATGDGPLLSRAAHTLKGAAGLFGAVEVTRAASEMEGLGRAGDLARAERVCADLEAALTRLLHALTGFVEEFSGAKRG